MRDEQQGAHASSDRDGLKRSGAGQASTGLKRSGSDLDKRFPVALGLYAVLALLVWFTMDGGSVLVMGKPVEIRWIPILIIGGLALRTVLARSAEKIRRGEEKESL